MRRRQIGLSPTAKLAVFGHCREQSIALITTLHGFGWAYAVPTETPYPLPSCVRPTLSSLQPQDCAPQLVCSIASADATRSFPISSPNRQTDYSGLSPSLPSACAGG